jgi:hypothetical protein
MPDDRLRSLENLERLVEIAARSSKFWRNFNRIVLPAKEFETLLESFIEEIPMDIRKAKEMLDARDRLMEEAIARSEKIVDEAAGEAGRLLDESEIVRKARRTAAALREEADRYVLETLERLEDNMAVILKNLKKAQSDLVSEMETRRRDITDKG